MQSSMVPVRLRPALHPARLYSLSSPPSCHCFIFSISLICTGSRPGRSQHSNAQGHPVRALAAAMVPCRPTHRSGTRMQRRTPGLTRLMVFAPMPGSAASRFITCACSAAQVEARVTLLPRLQCWSEPQAWHACLMNQPQLALVSRVTSHRSLATCSAACSSSEACRKSTCQVQHIPRVQVSSAQRAWRTGLEPGWGWSLVARTSNALPMLKCHLRPASSYLAFA